MRRSLIVVNSQNCCCDAPHFNFDRFPADWRDRIEIALGGLTFLGFSVAKLRSLKSVTIGIAMKSASVDLAGIYLEVEGKLAKLSFCQQS